MVTVKETDVFKHPELFNKENLTVIWELPLSHVPTDEVQEESDVTDQDLFSEGIVSDFFDLVASDAVLEDTQFLLTLYEIPSNIVQALRAG